MYIFNTIAAEIVAGVMQSYVLLRRSAALIVPRQNRDVDQRSHATARGAILVLCLLLAMAGAQARAQEGGAGTQASAAPPVSEALRGQLLKLVPDPLPAQAISAGAPVFYGSNLWEYIDGAADQFLLFGMDGMIHQEFKAGKVDLTVDIFSMGQAENAFGMYATERSTEAHFISMGTEGYSSQSSDGSSTTLIFFLGRYYIKLSGFGPGSSAVLDAFARAIAGRIDASPGWPALLAQLPVTHRIAHTEQYVLQNPLGHDFLSPAYSVKYQWEKNESTLLVSVAADGAEAERRLGLLEKHLRQYGQCAAAPELGEGAIRGKTSYEGEIVARTVGRYLVLMINPAGSASDLFRETLTRLK